MVCGETPNSDFHVLPQALICFALICFELRQYPCFTHAIAPIFTFLLCLLPMWTREIDRYSSRYPIPLLLPVPPQHASATGAQLDPVLTPALVKALG